MKLNFTYLCIILLVNISYTQNSCQTEEGLFQYTAQLDIEILSDDFNKNDLIDFITLKENISEEEIITLNDDIINVEKINPENSNSRRVSIEANQEMYSILVDYDDSFKFFSCFDYECLPIEGVYQYYVVLEISSLPDDFQKEEFINFIIANDQISDDDINYLEKNIIDADNAFTGTLSPLLARVVFLRSFEEFGEMMGGFLNSLDFFVCIEEGGLLNLDSFENKPTKMAVVYPNPITKDSKIQFSSTYNKLNISLFSATGSDLYQNEVSNLNELLTSNQ
ncbi:hypothetical protein P700755_000025 [Psychroflexus torquis ATCC 700755]|uniref:Uncharacterized protein n=1 Tax=Psychroflexus torquis (strain ATCC 700755 / CIP 106069 / ACAM 623) TaxID=313595 RepID=K4IDC4_PSYTT|nr:hypothetical protein [Psychroflexus torquis]AFU67101.1 hypothetical protein P700755_000025 [Psychroflexus torquis ATCC 700755]